MKLSIAIVVASILIIGLVDFSDATFLPWPPAPCPPPAPKPPVKPHPKPPVKPHPKPPVLPPKPAPKPPVRPHPKPPVKPCEPPRCGPGGPNCQGCPNRDNLCMDLIKSISELQDKIKKCVCGVKYV